MYIGNILLLILSIPLVGMFVRILRVRPAILAPITALITILGVYTINNSMFDIFLMVAFGIIGYLMKKAGFDPGPMVLAFVLGSIIESSTRRSLLIFGGDPTGFVTRPISGTILAIFVVLALLPLVRHLLSPPGDASPTSPTRRSTSDVSRRRAACGCCRGGRASRPGRCRGHRRGRRPRRRRARAGPGRRGRRR